MPLYDAAIEAGMEIAAGPECNGQVSGMNKFDHILQNLLLLHWLPVVFCVRFKILMIVYKGLNGLGPHDHLVPIPPICHKPYSSRLL